MTKYKIGQVVFYVSGKIYQARIVKISEEADKTTYTLVGNTKSGGYASSSGKEEYITSKPDEELTKDLETAKDMLIDRAWKGCACHRVIDQIDQGECIDMLRVTPEEQSDWAKKQKAMTRSVRSVAERNRDRARTEGLSV